jgi:hypothetical protein
MAVGPVVAPVDGFRVRFPSYRVDLADEKRLCPRYVEGSILPRAGRVGVVVLHVARPPVHEAAGSSRRAGRRDLGVL